MEEMPVAPVRRVNKLAVTAFVLAIVAVAVCIFAICVYYDALALVANGTDGSVSADGYGSLQQRCAVLGKKVCTTKYNIRGFAPSHPFASLCLRHCSTCVALVIRGMMI